MKCSRVAESPTRFHRNRRGFTIVELLVATGIIALLIALILPAVQQARASARRLQCKNNLRNVALALTQETDSKQRFPANGYFGLLTGDYHNWVVMILPWIEQSVIYDKWDFDVEFDAPENLQLGNTHIPVLVCPADETRVGAGDLSYVVNGGFAWTGPPCGPLTPSGFSPIDLNGSGICTTNPVDGTPSDRTIQFQTGLMSCENHPPVKERWFPTHNMGTLRDGASQTIMMTENVHAGVDPASTNGNWANPGCWRNSFYLSGHICKDFSCTPQSVNLALANDKTQTPTKFEGINPPFQVEGVSPWPTSFHSGGVNAAFCDGSIRFISENLDSRVYYSMVTPQGVAVQGPLSEGLVGDNSN